MANNYRVGDRIQVKIDAKLPRHLTFCRCFTGEVVRVLGLLSVRLDPTKNTNSQIVLLEERWVEKLSKPVESLKVSEDSTKQPTIWEVSTGSSQSSVTTMPLPFSNITGKTRQSIKTSKTFSQSRDNSISSSADSRVTEHQQLVLNVELLTQSQPSSGSSLDVSSSPDQSSYSWSNLKDLSIEDLEAGLADSTWQDIKASLQSCLQLINLERQVRESECLFFPTLLSGDRPSSGTRPAGQTKCEKWWKDNVIQRRGYQLSARAMSAIQGFPMEWLDVISPYPIATPGESEPDTSWVKPSQSPKLELPSVSSSGCGTESNERSFPLEKSRASGWIEQQTKNTKLKGGIIATYPRVEGERDPDNLEHWYWNYRYEVKTDSAKSDNGHVTKAVSLKRSQVAAVQLAISRGWSIEKILSYIRGEIGV